MKILFLLLILFGCAEAKPDLLDPTSVLGVIMNVSLIRPEYCRSYPTNTTSTYINNSGVSTLGSLSCTGKPEILGLSCSEDLGNGTKNQYTIFYSSLNDYVNEAVQFRNFKQRIEYTSPSVVTESFTTDSDRRIVTNSNANATNVTLTYNVWDTAGRPTAGIYQVPGCNPASITVTVDANSYFFSSNIQFAGGGGSCSSSTISVRTTNQFDTNFFLTKKVQIISNNGTPFNTTQSLYETKQSQSYCYR